MAETIYWQDGSVSMLCPRAGGNLMDAFLDELRARVQEPDAERFLREYKRGVDMELTAALDDAAEKERASDGYFRLCHDAMDCLEEINTKLRALPSTKKIREIATLAQNGCNNLYTNL